MAPLLRDVRDELDGLLSAMEPAPGDPVEPAAVGGAVTDLVARGRLGRERLRGKHGAPPRRLAEVSVVVDDRVGGLAALLVAARGTGVNVEDLRIDHAPGTAVAAWWTSWSRRRARPGSPTGSARVAGRWRPPRRRPEACGRQPPRRRPVVLREQVDPVLRGADAHTVPAGRQAAGVGAHDDVGVLAVDLRAAVDVGVRAELLHHVDPDLQAVLGQVQVLRAHPERHAAGAADVGQDVALHPVRHVPDAHPVGGHPRVQQVHGGRADEAGHEGVVGVVVQAPRAVHLLQHAVAHDGDPVAHRHGLDLVVGDVGRS